MKDNKTKMEHPFAVWPTSLWNNICNFTYKEASLDIFLDHRQQNQLISS